VNVICHKCSFYFSLELSGRRQLMDCPQCKAFVGEPDREGGLVVKVVCRTCMLGHPVDVLSQKMALVCPDCGTLPKVRDRALLRKVAEVHRLRRQSHGKPIKSDSSLRVNLAEMEIDPGLIERVPGSIALAYRCVPIRFEHGALTVVLPEPTREAVLEDLALVLKCAVQGAAAPRGEVEKLLSRYYGQAEGGPSA
jgi:Zn finger protein HypA/HybF involved in hydrogenase expression